jgi:uncharacterized membrane protein YhhN
LNSSSIFIGSLCLAFAVGYVLAERKGGGPIAWLAKAAASTCFLVLAFVNGAADSTYGRLVLAALTFSWLGDALLLSIRGSFLLGGIVAFLAAHVAYAGAFASRAVDPTAFLAALIFWNLAVFFLIRWLWNYLEGYHRVAVPVYLAAITVMASLAVATLSPLITVAAAIFAVSDISVARDRFVKRTIANKAWGIPLYYFAQVLFAVSVIQQ